MLKTLLLSPLCLFAPGWVGTAHSQIFIANNTSGLVSEYSLSGTELNPSFATGLTEAFGVATDGSYVYVSGVAAGNSAVIAKYDLSDNLINIALVPSVYGPIVVQGGDLFTVDLTRPPSIGQYTNSGSPVNASLFSFATGRQINGMAAGGDDLFFSYVLGPPINGVEGALNVAEYVRSTNTINDPFISGSGGAIGLAVDGDDLFLANSGGFVSEYSTSGNQLSSSIIPGLNTPSALTIAGNDLFLVDEGTGTVGQYTTSGDAINPTIVTGLTGNIFSVAVVVPEPATISLLALAGSALLLRRRHPREM
jgi:hypothetical protein